MTKNEKINYAIKELKDFIEFGESHGDRNNFDYCDYCGCITIGSAKMAIKALEQQPCEDAVSRQAALDAMYELCDTGETLKENPWRDNPHIDAVVETIEELPSVNPQPKTGWIPVSERLPEQPGRYLCTVGAAYRNPREMIYAPQKWANKCDNATWRSTDGNYVYDWFVTAWMPLPEPYEPQESEG